ncbi:ATP-binding protein [Salinisphaera sp. P385]|uniref:histidine kinase n=1 Tax=Spectribacter acetivorans TaxID=3075603 RepID=A0ABU3B5Q2_9GAMM|nr:ATP-binding protein [Salinisphaera sp. P385]MDT0617475.1 ATP-binding protein [Salinisphaera sp. P385]
MRLDRNALQFRLVAWLALVFALAAVAITAAVVWESRETAAALGREALAHELLAEFVTDMAWLIPVIALAALAMAVITVRRSLRPLRETSALAARIGPAHTDIRLPEAELPSELKPLVGAVNRALERLDTAFAQQRRFTADAAHQLRTPLAILSANIEASEGDGQIAALRADTARMNRLVDQLLRVARLEAEPLDTSARVDLVSIARRVVGALAALAIRQERELVLVGAEAAVFVTGNEDAIENAMRNLIENALAHTPANTEVTVTVDRPGRVSVADRGRGIAEAERAHLFDRFWRGRDSPAGGAGLGLAIVAEIMRAHGGRVDVGKAPGGGAAFTLVFGAAR